MSQFFQIHPETPQKRLINQAVDILRKGGVIVYPTDSAYAIGCHLGDKQAADRIKRIRRLDDKHNFTLMCRDLSDIGVFAKVDNTQYRLLKNFTPGLIHSFWTPPVKYRVGCYTPSVKPLACGCQTTRLCRRCWRNWANPS